MRDTAPGGSAACASAKDDEHTTTHEAIALWIDVTRMSASLLARESAWESASGRRTWWRMRAMPSASPPADTSDICHTGRQVHRARWRCATARCTEKYSLRSAHGIHK